jgi:hypothetical protein
MTTPVIGRVRQPWALWLAAIARVRRHRVLVLTERELGKGDPHLRTLPPRRGTGRGRPFRRAP